MKCRVRTDDGITAHFNMDNGLMQGESISPTVFSAFINDIVEAVNKITSMGVVKNNIKITVLKNADDLVLLATSQEGLQSGLDLLKTYCEENKLTVNVSKSKVMRVSKRRKAQSVQLYYDSELLKCVDSFKYLGIRAEHYTVARRIRRINPSHSFPSVIVAIVSHGHGFQTV